MLTGKYRRGEQAPNGSRLKEKPQWLPAVDDDLFDRLERIEAEAKAAGRTLLAHTVIETLGEPGVASILIGAKRIEHLESVLAIVG